MPEARKQTAIRQAVRERAQGRCEYCLSPDDCSPAPFNVEHIVPTSRGGADTLESLAWSCGGCNGSKGTKDRWEDHFAWGADPLVIVGKSAT